MNKTGVLVVSSSRVSRLQGWRILARAGEDSPQEAATDFLLDGKGLDPNDTITVTGTLGALDDGTAVCFITDAVEVSSALAETAGAIASATASGKSAGGAKKAAAKKPAAKKAAAKKSTKKSAKDGGGSGAKRATKKAAKKAAKKGGAKKAAKKVGTGKGAAERTSKRRGSK